MIKIAFIGAGYMAAEHLKAFSIIPSVNIAGIYSRTKERAIKLKADYPTLLICNSISDLYKKLTPDLVIIAVPELSVREVCLEAFKYPWACLIEKPVGYNLEDAEIIAKAAHAFNAKAFVALNRRHYSATVNVLEELSHTKQPRLIHIYDQENPDEALASGQPELIVKNWMYANSIHLISYFNILGRGEIVSVENIISWDPENPRLIMSKLSYDSGDIGIYEAVWNSPGPWAVVVSTQKKRWELRPLEELRILEYKSRKPLFVEPHHWDKEFKPGLRLQAEESLKMLRGEDHQLPSIFEALKTMRLINKIYGV